MKYLDLTSELKIPALGAGTWQLAGDAARQSVEDSLEVGYRHLDTADRYGNHKEVAAAIKASGVKRDELFITTKVFHQALHKDEILSAGPRFLEELEMDYIDLLLIHWPNPDIPLDETLEAMNELKEKGIIKAIGVSNFNKSWTEKALAAGVEVVNNQIEIHPTFNQDEFVKWSQEKGVTITAYSPLARGQEADLAELKTIAEKHSATIPQVIISWLLARDIIVIPRSTKMDHIKQNFESLNVNLDEEDMTAINNVHTDNRMSKPEWANFDEKN